MSDENHECADGERADQFLTQIQPTMATVVAARVMSTRLAGLNPARLEP